MPNKKPSHTDKKERYEYVSLLSPRFMLVIGGFFAALILIFMRMGAVTQSTVDTYEEMVRDATSSHTTAQKDPYTAQQNRSRIQKDLFFYKGQDRLQIKLKAAEAQLVLDHKDSETQIVEHMQKVKCVMQEDLYYLLPNGKEVLKQIDGRLLIRNADPQNPDSWVSPDTAGLVPMQLVRFIDAEDAQYEYKADRFIADNVRISRYAMPGHELKEGAKQVKPLMSGTAKRVEFSLKGNGNDLNFKAYHLKATFHDMSHL